MHDLLQGQRAEPQGATTKGKSRATAHTLNQAPHGHPLAV